ncbi:Sodium:sulfate symporter transmembrane region family protein [Histomonas meleagridis]|uniref:Sodium:sulfate symporter transmembrane region family protein n=1 Tax=Histomonas meleagridis TaxID=135588 RepID=UPI00355A1EA1|nr:Sodium:sulfate symporter transmembrane region family protein [Histomonas meleagridis]KAH0799429.1 Sodium:sulfate symporter transmembrane region family protein [Histomonas meleagridis]
MKFGKQLRFVAVKQWYDRYIPYKDLKKMIKQFISLIEETTDISPTDVENLKNTCNEKFISALRESISQIATFYSQQYEEIEKSIDEIRADLDDQLESDERSEEAEKSFHKRIYGEMLTVYELRTFLEVNKTGGEKIVKKFARLLSQPEFREEYLSIENEIFGSLSDISILISQLEDLFVTMKRRVSPNTDHSSRSDIVVQLHSQVENALLWKQSTVLSKFEAMTFRHNELLLAPASIKAIPLVISLAVLLAFQFFQFTLKFEMSAQRCLGIVFFAAILWATGAVPLWLTSLSIPFLGVVCGVLPDSWETVGKVIHQSTMSSTVFLTIGGFTIAAGLRETELDKRIAMIILQKASCNKRLFLLVLIILNAFIAMWISNITSTMIVVALVVPTLKQIPRNSEYIKAMLFAIAVGGNLGGMMTPLSSPQNAVTVEAVAQAATANDLDVSVDFVEFFATALPYAIVCCLIAWVMLQIKYKMDIDQVPPVPNSKTEFGWMQWFVGIISLGTIAIWISLPFGGNKAFSDYGVVGLIPVLMFYGIGILNPSKITELPWNIIFMLMGGNALCKIVTDSGLMEVAKNLLESLLGGTSLWVSILIVNACVLVIDILLTHTVSSMITLPLVCTFAANSGHLALYAMCACMTTTASQVLPVSSFPNICTVSLQDDTGKNYLTSKEMIIWGIIVTIACLIACVSVYYGIGLAYGM